MTKFVTFTRLVDELVALTAYPHTQVVFKGEEFRTLQAGTARMILGTMHEGDVLHVNTPGPATRHYQLTDTTTNDEATWLAVV